ncbi:MAG TPA: hypothetical protein VNW52_04760 [Burkholderiaceae bacterium]|jgi:hypothetical protein|nr:hypothetical protein [Burkholderiaceae bacterium]
MKNMIAPVFALMLSSFLVTANAEDTKPYKEGPVIQVTYVKTKAGKFDEYMKFLATDYKAVMEAEKKAGLIVSYDVFSAQPRNPHEADLILSTTYANMAALDKDEEGDAVVAKVMGSTAVQNKGAQDRESLREILGSELIRELTLK